MQDLIELTSLLDKTKLKNNGLMRFILEPDSKMELFFNAVTERKIQSDDDARTLLVESREDTAYLPNLKSKLKERLLDTFFLLDFKESNFSNRQKAYFECQKKWSVIMSLLVRGAKITAIELAERLLRHSKRFEFTELTLDILRTLHLQYSLVEGDVKKYEEVKKQYAWYETVWLMESKAERSYTEIMMHYTNSKATQPELKQAAIDSFAALEPFMAQCDSFKLHLYGRLIQILIYNIDNDYVNTARLCEDVIDFYDKKSYDSGLPLQVFYYNLIACYMQLKEYDKGRAAIGRCEYYFEEGSFNWFKLHELFFLLAMHTGHYENAYEVYEKVKKHPRFEDNPVQIHEMWRIFQAYLYYLIKVGKIPAEKVGAQHSKFKINKFINEISLFSKDKRGMNVAVLIVQILYSLADKNYDQTVDRIEAIEKYCSRYLNENDTFRSNCFIKMLLQIPQASFHREAVARKTERYYKMLRSMPLEMAQQPHETEIVPIEALWEMTIESLDLKIYKQKKR
jgi:hypothetical protein